MFDIAFEIISCWSANFFSHVATTCLAFYTTMQAGFPTARTFLSLTVMQYKCVMSKDNIVQWH